MMVGYILVMHEKIKEMVENGFAIAKISKSLQLPRNEVKAIVDAAGWIISKTIFNNDSVPRIVQLYRDGVIISIIYIGDRH